MFTVSKSSSTLFLSRGIGKRLIDCSSRGSSSSISSNGSSKCRTSTVLHNILPVITKKGSCLSRLRLSSSSSSSISSSIKQQSRKAGHPQPGGGATATAGKNSSNSTFANQLKVIGIGTVITITGLHFAIGSQDDYYCYRFITKKDPDDLATFYGGEEFMELFCGFPIFVSSLLRAGTFDEEGTVHTKGFPGEIQASMVFSDEEDEETGKIVWFNKRERFKDVFLGIKMWDTVHNFGFQRLSDGRIECYHHGEYFYGYSPPISLLMKIFFQLHGRWVAWATEHHINHYAFTSKTEEEEEMEELSRSNFALHLLKNHFWRDFNAMIFGTTSGSSTTPNTQGKKQSSKTGTTIDEEEHESSIVSFLALPPSEEERIQTRRRKINIKRQATMRIVKEDIAIDKQMTKSIMDGIGDFNNVRTDINKRKSDGKTPTSAYKKANDMALQKHQVRIAKRRTTVRMPSKK